MARKLRLIAPFDSASGNLSGAQKLLYAKNNNPSWDAPIGSNAARNYKTRYIGVYRTANGSNTFAVRTKSIANNSEKMRRFQALFGGSAACFIEASQNLVILTQLQSAYQRARESNPGLTFRKWLTDYMYWMLSEKMPTVAISTPLGTVTINNPWVEGGTGTNLNISDDVLVKFWMYLANNPVQFTITTLDGTKKTGVAHGIAETFEHIIASRYNVLDLSSETTTANLMMGELYVVFDEGEGRMIQVGVGDAVAQEATLKYFAQDTPGGTQG